MFLSIKMADSVTVQNETQNLLEQNFQVEGKLIKTPIPHKNRFKKTYKQNPPLLFGWVHWQRLNNHNYLLNWPEISLM